MAKVVLGKGDYSWLILYEETPVLEIQSLSKKTVSWLIVELSVAAPFGFGQELNLLVTPTIWSLCTKWS